jgi:hypothetical protein
VIEPNEFSDVLSFYTGAIMSIISQDVKPIIQLNDTGLGLWEMSQRAEF